MHDEKNPSIYPTADKTAKCRGCRSTEYAVNCFKKHTIINYSRLLQIRRLMTAVLTTSSRHSLMSVSYDATIITVHSNYTAVTY